MDLQDSFGEITRSNCFPGNAKMLFAFSAFTLLPASRGDDIRHVTDRRGRCENPGSGKISQEM